MAGEFSRAEWNPRYRDHVLALAEAAGWPAVNVGGARIGEGRHEWQQFTEHAEPLALREAERRLGGKGAD